MKLYQQFCLALTSVLLLQDAVVVSHDSCSYNDLGYDIDESLYFFDNCIQYVCSYNHRAGVVMDIVPINYCYCPDLNSRVKREAIEHQVNTALGFHRNNSDQGQLARRKKRSAEHSKHDCVFNHVHFDINVTIFENVHHCLTLTCVDNEGDALIQFNVMENCSCEIRGACEENPCNNGICIPDHFDTYNCSCYPGYTGVHCEIDIDECDTIYPICLNGGHCNDEVNGFSCSCIDPWVGQFCELDFDDCASSPCVGGECKDEVNDYRCECYEHWSGRQCHDYTIDINGRVYALNPPSGIDSTYRTILHFENNDEIRMYRNEVESLYEVHGDDFGWVWTSAFRYESNPTYWFGDEDLRLNPELNVEENDSLDSACVAINKVGHLKEFDCTTSHYSFES